MIGNERQTSSALRVFHHEVDQMYGLELNHSNKRTDESPDGFSLRQSVEDCRIAICHVTEGSAWAGAEVQVATLLRALSKCPEIALHAIVLHEGRLASELRSFGVVVQVINNQHKSFPQIVSECSAFVRSRNIQVLHSHDYKLNLIALSLSHICNVPHLVRTEHGRPEPYSAVRNLKHWCVLIADRLAARYTSAQILSVSSDLGEYWKMHVNPRNVTVLHNAVDLERVSSNFSPAEAKRRLGIPCDSFVVGIAARLECIKRHDLFIATARYLAERIPKSNFIIAGGGRQKESLQRLILEAGLQERVALLGERNDVYDVMRAMDILLICSDHEGIPMVMLEAMALGVAVVARKVGGMPEVIRHGVNGILVPSDSPVDLGRACWSIFKRPRLRANLTQIACDEIHRRYSAEKHARTVVELYQSICRRQVQ
jgi:glycosyltransferase involved in cell wall biosynthesis